MTGPRPGEPGAYPYPGPQTGVVPDSSNTDERWVEDVRRQVQQQMSNPVGSRPMVAEVGANVGNLIDDPGARASIGAAAAQLHTAAHGE
jgi:phage baseplate assembly protein W